MASTHLVVGAVLYANEETILLTDRPEYEILDGRNVLMHVPEVRE
jgi:hypothetical protein